MGLFLKSNYRFFFVSCFDIGEFLEALGIGIGACSIFCHSFLLLNNVWKPNIGKSDKIELLSKLLSDPLIKW